MVFEGWICAGSCAKVGSELSAIWVVLSVARMDAGMAPFWLWGRLSGGEWFVFPAGLSLLGFTGPLCAAEALLIWSYLGTVV